MIFISSCRSTSSSTEDLSYFIPLPFSKFSAIQAPCLDVQLEGETFSLELDLGFQGELTIDPEPLNNLLAKTFLHSDVTDGIRGKKYETDLYRIPEAQIGPLVFTHPILQSNSHQFTQDSVFVKKGKPSLQEVGRIGWKLFQSTPLLVDVPRETLIICDSLNALKAHGYGIESFSKSKLFTNRGLLEFEAHTSSGPLLCTLDTGCSWNIINATTHTSIQEALWDPENVRITPTFSLENQDFGPISFHAISIQMAIPLDAILGMEFFRDHLVFIDFSAEEIYISKNLSN